MNATESTVTLNHTLKLKGVTKYAAVYTIPGVPGQLMVRRNMLGGEAPQELVIEGIEFKPVDPKAAERQARASKRTDSAQERAVKAAERAKKAVERARKAQELADRLAGKKADAEVDETTDGPNDPDAAEGDAASA